MTPAAVCTADATMNAYAVAKTAELLTASVAAITAAARNPDADAVHDMRVSIRRLQQSIRVFAQYLPKRGSKRVKRELKRVMEPAGELRNYDIALELAAGSGAVAALEAARSAAESELQAALAEIASEDLFERWRAELRLEVAV